MRSNEGFNFTSASNANSQTFLLKGGKYAINVLASSYGTVDLKILGPDGSTQVAVITQLSANKFQVVDLPPGQYQFINGTVTSISESIVRIPND